MTNEPKVSVCMLAYNHERYIAQAIESVLAQKTGFKVTLVIGEDCSTDGTRAIVEELAARHPGRILPILHERNVGPKANFDETFARCRGEYVATLDGDDYWHRDDKLALQVEALEARPECSFACSDYDQLDGGRRIAGTNASRGWDPSKITDLRYVIRGTPTSGMHPCTLLARRTLAEDVVSTHPEFVNWIGPAGDTVLFTALAALGRICYLPDSLATYRWVGESFTRSAMDANVLRMSIRMKEQMLRLCEHHGVAPSESVLHRRDLAMRRLKLAWLERDADAAGRARDELRTLTLLQRLQFMGARSGLAHRASRPVLRLLDRRLIPTAPEMRPPHGTELRIGPPVPASVEAAAEAQELAAR